MRKIRTRKRGSRWYYGFDTGRTADGKRTSQEHGGFDTESEAYDAGIRAYNQWKYGIACQDNKNVTVREFMESWLEYCKGRVRPQSLECYRYIVRCHIPYFGDLKLSELTPLKCDAWLQQLVSRGFALGSIRRYKSILTTALSHAAYPCQLIATNPMQAIKLPRKETKSVTKREIISKEKYRYLLDKYPVSSGYGLPMRIAYHTGMRIGEILGLLWENVDLERRIIHVRTQLIYVPRLGHRITNELKTESSRRDVFLDDGLCDILRAWQDEQYINSIIAGGAYRVCYSMADGIIHTCSMAMLPKDGNPTMLDTVCTIKGGGLLTPSSFARVLRSEHLNSHSFRHTHATMLLEAGVPVKGIACRLGHRKTNITQDIYIHNTDDLQAQVRDVFQQVIDVDDS